MMDGLRLSHMTLRDPTLTHQVIFSQQRNASPTYVSCNCCGTLNSQGIVVYEPIGPTRDLDESRRLYNDPANHRKPFTEEDEALW